MERVLNKNKLLILALGTLLPLAQACVIEGQGGSASWTVFGVHGDPLPARAKTVDLVELERLDQLGLLKFITTKQAIFDPNVPHPGPSSTATTAPLSAPSATSPNIQAMTFKFPSLLSRVQALDQMKPMASRPTLDAAATRQVIAAGRELYERPQNQAIAYKTLYRQLPSSANALSPEAFEKLPAQAAAQASSRLNTQIRSGAPGMQPAARGIVPPTHEKGEGTTGSDRTGVGTACENHSPTGIYSALDWPLKAYTTSVKDQGPTRASCSAFAAAGAIEAAVAVRDGEFVNLSEQQIYAQTSIFWWFKNYSDGSIPLSVWLKSESTQYVFPLEETWAYNSSSERKTDTDSKTYSHSCDAISADDPYCTDTVHQGAVFCAEDSGKIFCADAVPENKSGLGYQVDSAAELLDFDDWDSSLAAVQAQLLLKNPVIMAISVPQSLMDTDSSGYVHFAENETAPIVGGHEALVTGFVTNEQLKQAFPDQYGSAAVPEGAGGGYLIMKNSWGLCKGDAGYYYIPFDWAKANAWSFTVLSGLKP